MHALLRPFCARSERSDERDGMQVLVTDPSKLQAIRDREEDIMKERIELILKAVRGAPLFEAPIFDVAA